MLAALIFQSQNPVTINVIGKTLRRRRVRRARVYDEEIHVNTYEAVTDEGTQDWELSELLNESARIRDSLEMLSSRVDRRDITFRKGVLLRRLSENEQAIAQIEEETLVTILSLLE